MKYTARDESRVANIARGKAKCYIFHKTLIKSCILSYKRSSSVLLYFTLTKVSAKYSSLVILPTSNNMVVIEWLNPLIRPRKIQ